MPTKPSTFEFVPGSDSQIEESHFEGLFPDFIPEFHAVGRSCRFKSIKGTEIGCAENILSIDRKIDNGALTESLSPWLDIENAWDEEEEDETEDDDDDDDDEDEEDEDFFEDDEDDFDEFDDDDDEEDEPDEEE